MGDRIGDAPPGTTPMATVPRTAVSTDAQGKPPVVVAPVTTVWQGAPATADDSFEADSTVAPRQLVAQALSSAPRPADDHPYQRYISAVREELKAKKLPISAEGVQVFVVGEFSSPAGIEKHGRGIVQTMAGPVGLATNADIKVIYRSGSPNVPEDLIDGGQKPLNEVTKSVAAGMVSFFGERAKQIADISRRVKPNSQVSFVNMSNGISIFGQAAEITKQVLEAPRNSTTKKSLERALGRRVDNEAFEDVFKLVAGQLRSQIEQSSAEVQRGKAQLQTEVKNARAKNVMIFKAAGNDQTQASLTGEPSDVKMIDTVDGMILIGAIALGKNPLDRRDDETALFSVQGPTLGTVGVRVPLEGGDREGTSYAAPLALSAAALMVAANPKITPDQLEKILKDTSRPVKGGLNEIDIVAAQSAARLAAESR